MCKAFCVTHFKLFLTVKNSYAWCIVASDGLTSQLMDFPVLPNYIITGYFSWVK